jgi:hypothetical protein
MDVSLPPGCGRVSVDDAFLTERFDTEEVTIDES